MSKLPLLLAGIAMTVASPAFSQYNPPPGTPGIDGFVSPLTLAGAGDAATFEPPASDALNPASSGATQRTTLDLSYVTLAGLGDDSGLGSALNMGFTRPTRAGVFSASAGFRAASFDEVDWGSLASLNLSFSKDLYPNLLVGAGLGLTYGTKDHESDWAAGVDLGFVHLAGDRGIFRDLRWGGVLRDIGKGYAPDPDRDPFPAPFTPAVGAQAIVASGRSFALGVGADLSTPGFRDIAFAVGAEASIRDTSLPARQLPL